MITVSVTPFYKVPTKYPNLWRFKHDDEVQNAEVRINGILFKRHEKRLGLPEIYNLEPSHATELTPRIQYLSYALFKHGAPSLKEAFAQNRWKSLMHYKRAFTNGQGFGNSDDPRANYISGENLDAELPKFPKTLICGGATVTGTVEGALLKVSTLSPDNLPTLEELIETPWLYFHAVNSTWDRITRFPQGTVAELDIYEPVLVPLIASRDVYYPLAWLDKLPLGSGVADPYWLP